MINVHIPMYTSVTVNDAEIRALKQDLNGKRFGDVRGSSGKLDYSLTKYSRTSVAGTLMAR